MSRIKSLYSFAQKWQEHGNIVLFSDPHFGDPDRKFMGYDRSEKEQCKEILANLNSGDTVVCLGDLGQDWVKWMNYIKARRNHIYFILIAGNHDDKGKDKFYEFFDEVYFGPLMISPKVMLSHEPLLNNYWLNIHGHDHGGNFLECREEDNKVYGINLAHNLFKGALQLNNYVNKGGLKWIDDIHRQTIDKATEKKNNE